MIGTSLQVIFLKELKIEFLQVTLVLELINTE